MALTLSRWIALAVAGSLIAAAYFLPPRAERQRVVDPRVMIERRENSAGNMAARAADRLRVLQIRDSVLQALARRPQTDTSRVLFDAGLPQALREALAAAAARARVALPGLGRHPVDLVFVLDSGPLVRGVNRGHGNILTAEYLLPRSSSERCLILARVQPPPDDAMSLTQRAQLTNFARDITSQRLFGPCAFIGAFGVPGPHIDRWLLERNWAYATTVDWTRDYPRWDPPFWARQNWTTSSAGWPLRSFVSANGYRCATGASDSCRQVLLMGGEDRRVRRYPTVWGNRIVSVGTLTWGWWRDGGLGPNQGALLSEMVRTVGPERFGRFWASASPVEEAFRSATNQDIGDWTRDWAASEYGGGRGRGPAIPPLGAAIAITLVVVATGGAMWFSQRRQIA